MRNLRGVSVAAVVSTTLLVGCGSGQLRDPMLPGSGVQAPVQLTVQNNDFNDAVIYANWVGAARDRIGMVTGKTSQTLTFPWRSDVVQLEVDFIAGQGYFVDAIDVQAGDHLDLVIMVESSKGGRSAR